MDLKKVTDAELEAAVERVLADVGRRDEELREGLRYVLARSARSRRADVGVLAAGIVLAISGSVVGALT